MPWDCIPHLLSSSFALRNPRPTASGYVSDQTFHRSCTQSRCLCRVVHCPTPMRRMCPRHARWPSGLLVVDTRTDRVHVMCGSIVYMHQTTNTPVRVQALRRYMLRKRAALAHCPGVIRVYQHIDRMGTSGYPHIELHACWLLLPAGRRVLPGTLVFTSQVYDVENLARDHGLRRTRLSTCQHAWSPCCITNGLVTVWLLIP